MSSTPPPPSDGDPQGGDAPSWPAGPPDSGSQPPDQPSGQPTSSPPPGSGSTDGSTDGSTTPAAMPPPPPPSGGAAGQVPAGDYSPTKAITYGWTKFRENVGPILIGVVVLIVAMVIVSVIITFATGGASAAVSGDTTAGSTIGALIISFVQLLVSAAIVRAVLALVDGRPLELSEFFILDQMGQVAIAAILLALVTTIAGFIPVLGILVNVVVSFLAQFVLFFILDRNEPAMTAIKSSIDFSMANLGPLVVFMLLGIGVVLLGVMACLVGVFVALPVVAIAQGYTYRHLRNEPIAA